MAKVPYFPLYASDFLSLTADMSPEEVCAYTRLLCAQWIHGSIPSDQVRIERLALCEVTEFVLQHFPVGVDGKRRNASLEEGRQEYELFREQQRQKGLKRAEKAKLDQPRLDFGSNPAPAEAQPNGSLSPSPSPSPSPSESDSVNTLSCSQENKDAVDVLKFLNEEAGRRFRETKVNLGFIAARLAEDGVAKEEVFKMIRRQVARWKGLEYETYLRPETLFNKVKFDSYYEARDLPVIRDSIALPVIKREMNPVTKARLL